VNILYTPAYEPPAPVIEISLAVPRTNKIAGPFMALIDTGADATLVPRAILASLRVTVMSVAFLRSHWGERQPVTTYEVDIVIAGERFPSIEVAADETETEFILGAIC
jgi:hypothetical protein